MSDRLTGLILAAFAAWYGWTSGDYQAEFADPLGPAAFPALLAPPIGLLGLYLALRPDPAPVWPGRRVLAAQAVCLVLLVLYALALLPLGFLLSTAVLAAFLAAMLGARPVPAAVSGLALSLGCYGLFTWALELPLPAGTVFGG